jgi:hypothetical protein
VLRGTLEQCVQPGSTDHGDLGDGAHVSPFAPCGLPVADLNRGVRRKLWCETWR